MREPDLVVELPHPGFERNIAVARLWDQPARDRTVLLSQPRLGGHRTVRASWPRLVLGLVARRASTGRTYSPDVLVAVAVEDDEPLSLRTRVSTDMAYVVLSNMGGMCLGSAARRVRSGRLGLEEAFWMTRFSTVQGDMRAHVARATASRSKILKPLEEDLRQYCESVMCLPSAYR